MQVPGVQLRQLRQFFHRFSALLSVLFHLFRIILDFQPLLSSLDPFLAPCMTIFLVIPSGFEDILASGTLFEPNFLALFISHNFD